MLSNESNTETRHSNVDTIYRLFHHFLSFKHQTLPPLALAVARRNEAASRKLHPTGSGFVPSGAESSQLHSKLTGGAEEKAHGAIFFVDSLFFFLCLPPRTCITR